MSIVSIESRGDAPSKSEVESLMVAALTYAIVALGGRMAVPRAALTIMHGNAVAIAVKTDEATGDLVFTNIKEA